MQGIRSRFAPVAVAAAALVAALTRWWLQGSGNVYTAVTKRFYVPDPDLGWRVSAQHPIWLGLDACALTAVVVLAVAVIARRWRRLAWIIAAATVVLPVAAFASGPGPLHGRDTLPPTAAVLVESGIEGALAAPAGRYVVVPHAGTSVTAKLSAGGEAFDARFEHDITGTWRGDPAALAHPMRAEISVAAAAVDTGVGERTKHAREGYLRAAEFPRITVTLAGVAAVRQVDASEVAFRAPGTGC